MSFHHVRHFKGGIDLTHTSVSHMTATDQAHATYKAAETTLRGMMTESEWTEFQDEIYGSYREMTDTVNAEIERRQMAIEAETNAMILDFGPEPDSEPFEWTTPDGIFNL